MAGSPAQGRLEMWEWMITPAGVWPRQAGLMEREGPQEAHNWTKWTDGRGHEGVQKAREGSLKGQADRRKLGQAGAS